MKRLILVTALLFALSCQALPWDKEKKTYIQAVCTEPAVDKTKLAYTCCLYNEMEDDTQITQWVANDVLTKAKKNCARGGSNPCDCLGVGVHNGMTYSYEGSAKCLADSPVYLTKGEILPKQNLAAVCKAQTNSDQLVLVPAPALG